MSSLSVKVPSNAYASQSRCFAALICLFGLGLSFAAAGERSFLVFDPIDGGVIATEQAHLRAYPASLTKLMTLYLLFETLKSGRLTLEDTFVVSATAAGQVPKRMGLKFGSSIPVKTAIEAIIVFSANDVAVVVAEGVAGSEEEFVVRMNAKAATLGMSQSVFQNASGLPHPEQVSTARDLSLLSRALFKNFEPYFIEFSKLGFDHEGKHYNSHNNFLRSFKGAVGLKTGFTCRAGYNLAAAAQRDGRMVMGIVLGESTAGKRDAKMREVMRRAFESNTLAYTATLDTLPLTSDNGAGGPVNRAFLAEECINPRRTRDAYKVVDWSVVFGLETEKQLALERAHDLIRGHDDAKGAKPLLIPQWARNIIYRVAITGLTQSKATSLCLELRASGEHCIVLPPKAAQLTVTRALATLEWVAKQSKTPE